VAIKLHSHLASLIYFDLNIINDSVDLGESFGEENVTGSHYS
jgi:hypothetical protein